MSQRKRIDPLRGFPRGTRAALRKALAEELTRMGATCEEFIAGTDEPVTPEKGVAACLAPMRPCALALREAAPA